MLMPGHLSSVKEAGIVVGWLVFLYLSAALYSYYPDDPSWSVAAEEGREVQNRGGVFGAYISDILFSLFGRSAYLLCVVALFSWHILLSRDGRPSNRLPWPWCIVGVVLLMLSSSALESLRFYQESGVLPAGAGGAAGKIISVHMSRWCGFFGASLLLAGVWMMSWSLAAGLSWFAFFERIGRVLAAAAARVARTAERRRTRKSGATARVQRESEVAARVQLLAKPEPATVKIEPVVRRPRRQPFLPLSSQMLPTAALLDPYPKEEDSVSAETLEYNSRLIEKKLQDFGISAQVQSASAGPVVTRYDVQPATGVKGAQIVNLVKDLARALSVGGIRVLETVPGKTCMGLEIPNTYRRTVFLSELLSSENSDKVLPLALGKDAAGIPVTVDLCRMPHLLVAGATGSGKSVCINAMLLSLLFSAPPQQLRLILIDPKMLELSAYGDIPHLLAPVVTDMSLAPAALHWGVAEMERRYGLMAAAGVRGIVSYNKKAAAGELAADEKGAPALPLPYIVVVIDELADLMMVAGKKVEVTICRLAQKARAAGIHLILATQRPSVDVITGLIKANIPGRIAFQVASKVDSRTIIDQMGAELLLGQGDMLYLPPGAGAPRRIHGAFVSDEEVKRVTMHVRESGRAEYLADFSDPVIVPPEDNGDSDDALYAQAVEVVMEQKKPSISLVQRKLRIGYNRAARLIEAMEKAGIISEMDDTGARKILSPRR